MKKNAVGTLVKDIILVVVLGGFASLLCTMDGTFSSEMRMLFCIAIAGIPFGWRWASKLITAISIKGIMMKLGIAVLLGFIAIFVVLIGDVIRCLSTFAKAKKTRMIQNVE